VLSRAACVLSVAGALILLANAQMATAGGGGGWSVVCAGSAVTPTCSVSAQTPGSPVAAAAPPPTHPISSTTTCTANGAPAPCSLPGYGWLGANGCYYRPDATYEPPAGDTADLPPAGEAGGYYDVSCLGTAGTGELVVWLAAGTAPGPPPTAATLAQTATRKLTPTVGAIASSPPAGSEQLVNLPTWVWLQGWRALTATATVPGLSVTATATPLSAAWTFGDGSRVLCDGPGTPYSAADDPNAPSPTCGHTYTRPSVNEPGSAFPVTVTVTWAVRWTGDGQAGTEPDLRTTATTSFRVAESQAVNTTPADGNTT
jgi:hypothetical protein